MVKTNNSEQNCKIINYLSEVKKIVKNPDIFRLSRIVSNSIITKSNLCYHLKYIILILIRKRHFLITEEISDNIKNIKINKYKNIINNLKKCDYLCDKTLFIYFLLQEEYEFFVTIFNIVSKECKCENTDKINTKDIYDEYFSIK